MMVVMAGNDRIKAYVSDRSGKRVDGDGEGKKILTITNAIFNSKDKYSGVFKVSVDSYEVEFQESGVICRNMTINAPTFRSSLTGFNHYTSSIFAENQILLDNGTRISNFDSNCKNFAKANFVYNIFQNNITNGGCEDSFSLHGNLSTWVQNFMKNEFPEQKVFLLINPKGNQHALF